MGAPHGQVGVAAWTGGARCHGRVWLLLLQPGHPWGSWGRKQSNPNPSPSQPPALARPVPASSPMQTPPIAMQTLTPAPRVLPGHVQPPNPHLPPQPRDPCGTLNLVQTPALRNPQAWGLGGEGSKTPGPGQPTRPCAGSPASCNPSGSVHPMQPPRPLSSPSPPRKPAVRAPRASLRSRDPLHLRVPPPSGPPAHPPGPRSGGGGGAGVGRPLAAAAAAPGVRQRRGRAALTPGRAAAAAGAAGGPSPHGSAAAGPRGRCTAPGDGPEGRARGAKRPEDLSGLSAPRPAFVAPSVPPPPPRPRPPARRGQRPDPRAGGSRRFRARGAGAGGSRRRLGAALRPPRP